MRINSRNVARWVRVALALAAASGAASVHALDPTLSLAQLNHKTWLTKDGAPVGVMSMAQGKDGTLWIASRTGLYRFNGLKFSKYGAEGEEALQSDQLINAVISKDGSLWVAPLFGGLDRIQNGRVTHFPPGQELPRGTVRSIAVDRDGVVWAAANGGLSRFVGGHWERLGPEWKLPPGPTVDVVATPSGEIWVRTLGGLYQLPAGQKEFLERNRYKPLDIFNQATAVARDGSIWSFDTADRLNRSTPDGATVPVPGIERVGQVLFDRDGQLWVGGAHGVRRFRPAGEAKNAGASFGAAEVLAAPDNLSAPYISCIFEDREGNIWVSTTGGLDRFSNTDLVRMTSPFNSGYLSLSPGTPGAGDQVFINGQVNDGDGDVGGTARMRDGIVEKQWSGGTALASMRGADGSNWFASMGHLNRIAGDDLRVWPMPAELASRPAQTLVQDSEGAIWVSIGGFALQRFADGEWSPVKVAGLPKTTAIASGRDAKGRLWFGFPTGVAVVDQGKARNFTQEDGLDIGPVTAVSVTGARQWLGGERGVVHVEGTRFVPLETAQARVLSGVSGLAEDMQGGLWAATYSSVVHIPAAELKRAFSDETYQVRADIYDYLDGMPGVPRQLRPTPSLVLGGDGKVWVATDFAVFYIDPQRLHADTAAPPVVLRALRSGGTSTSLDALASVPTVGASNLEIDYEAWSLKVPERVHFRYRLVGVDEAWQDAGTRRTAYYSHLSPGRYVFEVSASVGNGEWNATPATLSFSVPPLWFQTWWFRLLCVLAGLALLWLLYLWRVAKVSDSVARLVRARLEERLSERERIARELHDTLLQSVQGMILAFHNIRSRMPGGDPLRQQIDGALDRTDEVLAEARDRVRDLRTPGREDAELSEALKAAAADIGGERNTLCTVTCSGQPVPLEGTVRDEIYRIAREAMVNAFEHAKAREIRVEVRYEAEELVVAVSDDGVGIDAQVLERGALAGHWGLPGMRERSERIDAELELTSSPQTGTRVCVKVAGPVAYGSAEPRAGSGPLGRIRQALSGDEPLRRRA